VKNLKSHLLYIFGCFLFLLPNALLAEDKNVSNINGNFNRSFKMRSSILYSGPNTADKLIAERRKQFEKRGPLIGWEVNHDYRPPKRGEGFDPSNFYLRPVFGRAK
jgi:hypothetical protein